MTSHFVRKFSTPTLLTLSLMAIACQSTAKYADRSAEIAALEKQKSQFVTEQEDVLAPEQFSAFKDSLEKAKALNAKQADADEDVATARKHAAAVTDKSKPSKAVLAEALKARRLALTAGAAGTETFKKVDNDLRAATQEAAGGDIDTIQKESAEFKNRYLNAEGDAIVFKTMGSEQVRFSQLKNGEAAAVAPQTFQRTEAKLADAERSIRASRYDATALAASTAISKAEVARLAKISSDAKRLKSETAAIEIFEKEQATLAMQKSMGSQNTALANQNSQLQNSLSNATSDQSSTAAELSATQGALSAANDDASKRQAFELNYTNARKLFNPAEAEVYKDGDNLIIRLKGLNFAKGQGALPAESAALLKKLGTAVSQFGSPRVRVEGHTDSTGSVETNSKLSQERAGIVKDYLVSQRIVRADDVVAQGRGEEGPLATNETAAGRAQNRRVDVIVQPTY